MITKLKGFDQIDPNDLELSPFKAIGKDWMELVAGEPEGEIGAMTCSWGGLGVMWNKPVAFVVVRGEKFRYTRHILDAQPFFNLCFLPRKLQKAKTFLGSTHGWDVPSKIEAAGLSCGWCGAEVTHNPKHGIDEHLHAPFIEESQAVLFCETVCSQELSKDTFCSPSVCERWYTEEGYHRLYIAEIRAAFIRPTEEA